MKRIILFLFLFPFAALYAAETEVQTDTLRLNGETLVLHFYGHSSLGIEYKGKFIYTDPVSQYAAYDKLPKADLILVTHEHYDHLDTTAIRNLTQPATKIVANENSRKIIGRGTALKNGQSARECGILIEAVPAYNTTPGHLQYHPKGRDNGYVVHFGKVKLYLAGDTEGVPEMQNLKDIDVAFLPANQPYTMTPAELRHAIGMIRPKIAYPYHLGDTDMNLLRAALKDIPDTDVRFRELQ